MLLVNRNVCFYRRNPVRLVMIKLIKIILININLFKSGFVDDFDRLKQAFCSEVNRFKGELLESNVVDRPQDISEKLVKQLQDHREFLRKELRNKNNMIKCLLEQLLKRDDTIFSYKNQVYNLKQKLSDLHTAQSNSYNSMIIIIL